MRRLLLLSVIWGWSFLFIKVAVDGMSPPTVAWARVALGAAFLAVLLRARRVDVAIDRRLWGHFGVAGLAGSAIPFTLLAWGEQRISTGLTAVLNASTPLFTAGLAVFVLGERLRRIQLAGLVVGLVGVAVAAGVGRADLGGSSLGGAAAAILAGLCYGFTFTWSKRHLMGVAPMVAAFGQLTAASLLLFPAAVVTSAVRPVELTATRIVAIALLGIVGSGLAYVLNFRIISELGPTRASLVTYIIPVVAVGVGIAVLDERFQFRALAGGLLIVAGIVAVNRHVSVGRPPAAGVALEPR